MTREDAIEYWEGLRKTFSSQLEKEENYFGRMHLQTTIDALDMAISALRKQDHFREVTKKVEPLTLDELRQMDGEPVWIVEDPDWGHWELSANAEDYVTDREPSFYGMKHNDPAGRYGLHKLGWLAYRQKPEEGTV